LKDARGGLLNDYLFEKRVLVSLQKYPQREVRIIHGLHLPLDQSVPCELHMGRGCEVSDTF